MLSTIKCNGEDYAVDYSLMTALQLCDHYNVDVTGLGSLYNDMTSQYQRLDFLIRLGVIALNDAAQREHREIRYDEFDVRDMLTLDVSFGEELINGLHKSLNGEVVFQEPPRKAAKRQKKESAE